MKLSVVMMIKNEEKYLESVLKSIEPIQKSLQTEIIIVDTGSEDDSVNIAKKFTDKIYYHKWNDDFASMRNKTISYATGEWLLVLDGDEIIDQPESLIDFIKSKKSCEYNTAVLNIKNFTSHDEKKFAIVKMPRLFRRTKTFKYVGKVHEQASIIGSVYYIETTLLHYGYVASDSGLMEYKYQRNVDLLKKELEAEPNNIYYWFQLSQSYSMNSDLYNAYEAILKAYELTKKEKNPYGRMYIFNQLAAVYHHLKKYKDLENLCQQVLAVKGDYLDLTYYLARAQKELYKNQEAIHTYLKYLDMANHYEDFQGAKDISSITVTLDSVEIAYLELCELYIREEMYDEVIDVNKKIKTNKIEQMAYQYVIESYLKTQKHEKIIDLYHGIIRNNIRFKYKMINLLEEKIEHLDNESLLSLRTKLAKVEDDYSIINKLKLGKEIDKNDDDLILRIDLRQKPFCYGEIINYLMTNKKLNESKIAYLDESTLEQFINFLVLTHKQKFVEQIQIYLQACSSQKNIFNKVLRKALLLSGLLSKDIYDSTFLEYVDYGIENITEVYKETIIEDEEIQLLKKDEDVFFLYIYKSKENNNKNNKMQAIDYLKKALKVYPKMADGIEILLEEIKTKQSQIKDELSIYTKKVKATIENLIQENELEKAKELIKQYEEVMPNDVEVWSMKGIIFIIEGKNDLATLALKKGLEIDNNNGDILYNLGYLNELTNDRQMSMMYYKRFMQISDNEVLVKDISNKISRWQSEVNDTEKAYVNKNDPQITIITFAYNVEKYIDECVNSVLNQSYGNFEWIILDNGSTDRTKEILDSYAEKDSRIKLFKNEKNSILNKCGNNPEYVKYTKALRTKYYCTLDSDDYLHKDFLMELYTTAECYDADIVLGGAEMFEDINPNNIGRRCPPDFFYQDITSAGDIFSEIYGCLRPVWGKLMKESVRREVVNKKAQCQFNMQNAEDTLINLYTLDLSRSIAGVNKVLYYYRVRENSLYHSQMNNKRYEDFKHIYLISLNLLKKWNKLNKKNIEFITNVLYYSLRDYINIIAKLSSVSTEKRKEAIDIILEDEFIKEILLNSQLGKYLKEDVHKCYRYLDTIN